MFKEKIDKIYISLIVLISALLVFDLFFNNGHSAHMDGRVHITTITQFYRAMLSGDLKPTWSNWFANYGMPVPMVAHQLISYLGAWITLITNNTITSWKMCIRDRSTITKANEIPTDSEVEPGMKLTILPVSGYLHTVVQGETVYTIADKYKVDPMNIVNYPFNSFKSPNTFELEPGQSLLVPE